MVLYDLLARSAETKPAAPAVSYRGGVIAYGELLAAADGFAGGLSSLGVRQDTRVGLLLPNCPPFVVAYLGASRAGWTVVPMNVLYRPDEARHILNDCEAEVLITADPFRPLVKAIRDDVPSLKHVVMVAEHRGEADEEDFRSLCTHTPGSRAQVTEEDVAVILYTSGTTGRPKGAMLTHRNLVANAKACKGVLRAGAEDCFLSALPLFHSFAAMVFLVYPVMAGARMQLMERFLPSHALNLMEETKASVFGGVPSMFALMLQVAREIRPDLSSLRICVSGGAPLAPDIWVAFEEAFHAKLVEGYGLTEASPVVAVNPPYGVRKPGSIGLPIPGVEVKIVDECDRLVEPGNVGELAVRGENVMKGYLHQPEETAKVIRNGWLCTGDLARMDEDGYLFIAERKKELIIVGGLNVYPGEVERVLFEHPAVLEAAAFGVADASRGEAVWAAVVLRPDQHVSEKDLQAFCRQKLASYKVPRRIDIREELPKNALGKVMRHVLREQAGEEKPSRASSVT